MKNDFKILAGFLDRAEPEVEGRALLEPPEGLKLKLRDIARNGLPLAEKAELISQLSRNRHWLALLAEEVKALRPQNQPGRKAR